MVLARRLAPYGDTLLALSLGIGLQIEIWVSDTEQRAALSAVGLGLAAALGARRRLPLVMCIVVVASFAVLDGLDPTFLNGSVLFPATLILGLYSYGANARGLEARAAVAVIPVAVAVFVANDGDRFHVGDVIFGAILLGGPWAAGLAIRLRRERESRLEDEKERAEAAIDEQRVRIARELHDVVAHAISVVVVQARGGRRMLDRDPATSREAFDVIERTGEQALVEMRRLLGVLRENDAELPRAPQPSLARLADLAEHMRASGLPVDVEVDGAAVELPPGVDVSAYRIVQEALTNVLKHAGPARARVLVRYGADSVVLEVVDDGIPGGGADNGAGHGLVGMRERVAVIGGELTVGARREGGFAVRAVLPYGATR